MFCLHCKQLSSALSLNDNKNMVTYSIFFACMEVNNYERRFQNKRKWALQNSKGFPSKNMQWFFWWMKQELKYVIYICDMSIWSYGLTHQLHSYWLVLCSSEIWTPWIITRLLATNLVIRSSTSSVGAPFVETTCPIPHGMPLAEHTV